MNLLWAFHIPTDKADIIHCVRSSSSQTHQTSHDLFEHSDVHFPPVFWIFQKLKTNFSWSFDKITVLNFEPVKNFSSILSLSNKNTNNRLHYFNAKKIVHHSNIRHIKFKHHGLLKFFKHISIILETILCRETSKQIWDSIKKYQGNVKAKRVQLQGLRIEFENLRMKSGEAVAYFFSRTMAIANKMWIHGEKMQDVTIVEKILRSMTLK